MVNVKKFLPGELAFPLKTFRIPEYKFKNKDKGQWEIIINKLRADKKYAGRVAFEVVAKENSHK